MKYYFSNFCVKKSFFFYQKMSLNESRSFATLFFQITTLKKSTLSISFMKKLITWKPTSNFRHKLTNQRLGDFPGKIGDPLPNLSTNPRGSRNKPGRSYFIQREYMVIISIIIIIIMEDTKIKFSFSEKATKNCAIFLMVWMFTK